MRSLLLKLLETIGRVRLPSIRLKTDMTVGRPGAPDFQGTFDWRYCLEARTLSRIWGPNPQSPWLPFHCITLFAALDYLKHDMVGPCETDPWPVNDYVHPEWINPSTLLIVDMPGPASVALGAALGANGCDLICTFNNWPHSRGVIQPQDTLAAMLRYASWVSKKRILPAQPGPAAWLCDADRMGMKKGAPGEFDNRYYIEEAILPGPRYLEDRKITSVIYVCSDADTVRADLGIYLRAMQKEGIRVLHAIAAETGTLSAPKPYTLAAPAFSAMGFFRSSAGGFGAPVPHPSSGG
jgi:hypothetical protein